MYVTHEYYANGNLKISHLPHISKEGPESLARIHFVAEHVEKVVVKFVGSVNPGNDHCLEKSNPQKAQP